jgi:hypothetical protein
VAPVESSELPEGGLPMPSPFQSWVVRLFSSPAFRNSVGQPSRGVPLIRAGRAARSPAQNDGHLHQETDAACRGETTPTWRVWSHRVLDVRSLATQAPGRAADGFVSRSRTRIAGRPGAFRSRASAFPVVGAAARRSRRVTSAGQSGPRPLGWYGRPYKASRIRPGRASNRPPNSALQLTRYARS